MAYINCPECGKNISDQADACPQCGYPINRKQKKRISKKLIGISCFIAILCFAAGSFIFVKISDENRKKEVYNQAFELYQNDELEEAREAIENIPDYNGVDELLEQINEREAEIESERQIASYYSAVDLFQKGNFVQAEEIFMQLPEDLEIENESVDFKSIMEQIETYKQCVAWIKTFSRKLKNPDSLEIKETMYCMSSENLDKNVLYIRYKATNSFGAYVEDTACICDGEYIGENYKDLGLAEYLIVMDQSQELDAVIVQNGLNAYEDL